MLYWTFFNVLIKVRNVEWIPRTNKFHNKYETRDHRSSCSCSREKSHHQEKPEPWTKCCCGTSYHLNYYGPHQGVTSSKSRQKWYHCSSLSFYAIDWIWNGYLGAARANFLKFKYQVIYWKVGTISKKEHKTQNII